MWNIMEIQGAITRSGVIANCRYTGRNTVILQIVMIYRKTINLSKNDKFFGDVINLPHYEKIFSHRRKVTRYIVQFSRLAKDENCKNVVIGGYFTYFSPFFVAETRVVHHNISVSSFKLFLYKNLPFSSASPYFLLLSQCFPASPFPSDTIFDTI